MAEEPDKKIVSDNDWKQQARKEKEKLAQEKAQAAAGSEAKTGGASGQERPPMPPASFAILINSLAIQALYAMGGLGQSEQEEPFFDLDVAKHHIDMLQVLEDKTKGNLSEDEQKTLRLTLHELRMRFVAISKAM